MSLETWNPELRRWLEECSHEAGFEAAGVAEVSDPNEPAAEEEAERFAGWVDAGRAGEMEYLKRRDEAGRLVRSAVQVALPWARSVVVCVLNYNADAPRSIDPAPEGAGWIARYAWSGRTAEDGTLVPTDYHDELLGRLRRIETGLLEQTGCTTRSYVDTGPLVERSLAVQAGVGWIGKNTCVLNQELGSWLLLGVIVTSLPVEERGATMLAADRCGSCTRCIDACPTNALLGTKEPGSARGMDATRCIAYLTIEKKGAIDVGLRAEMGRQVFGCDICQDVCPWNRKAPVGTSEGMQARAELINPALEWLAAMDNREFKRRFKGSPLERTGRKRLQRSVAIAMGNSGETRYMEQLDTWRAGEDAVLAEAAEWARARIGEGSSGVDLARKP
ncbi:MAG TPA: tRNA epoxyqueuosine(34) reductase QueG [Acidobacteriaceae bacterium]